jgi:hypothetical protein
VAEFALVAPALFLVMLSLLELGRAVYYTQILDSAVRDAARYAIVHGFESSVPSGPLPEGRTNTVDPDGSVHVIPTLKSRAIGVVDTASPGFRARVKWCDTTARVAGVSACGDDLPCADWTGGTDPNPVGDGDNNRNQIVTVCIDYSYSSFLKTFVPVPDFTVSARTTGVINH